MEFTNKTDLPQYIADWLQSDNYDHNPDPYTISATTLMKPVRAHLLSIRHKNKLEMDVTDRIAARVGSALHDSIEEVETALVEKERRVSRDFTVGAVTYRITGKFDILQDNGDGTFSLRDIKTTSVWARIYGGKDQDYILQLSVYRWLLSTELNVNDDGYIDFFFTDWQASKAKSERDYPQSRIFAGHKVKLMSLEDTEQWILSRLEIIEENKNLADSDLNECSQTELWAGDAVFAVMKPNAKRATKLCDTQQEAEDYIRSKRIAGSIQYRPPKVKRCNYCAAFPFCNQGQSYHRQGIIA